MNKNQPINSTMIKLARQSRELTQMELARLAQVDQAKLSRLENSLYEKDQEHVIEKISEVLNYPVTFFRQQGEIYPPTLNLYRKRSSLSAKELDKIGAIMNILRLNIQKLLDSVEGLEINVPSCDVGTYGAPERIANHIRGYWNLPKGPIGNVVKLLERAGVFVFPIDCDSEKFDGVSMMVDNRIPIVFYNRSFPGDRQRFTIAHELGHIIMHIGRIPTQHQEIEEEANRFASEFLMPSAEIKPQLLNVTLKKVADLKPYWKVSMASLLHKAKTLNHINDNQYRYLWMQMAPYRKNEPPELEVQREKPELLQMLIGLYQKQLNYSNEELADLLCLTKKDFDFYFTDVYSPFRAISVTKRNIA